MKKFIAIAAAAVLLIPSSAWADKQDNQAFREGMKARRKEFRESRKNENKAFRDSLKDLSPEDRKKALLERSSAKFGERQAFKQENYAKRTEQLKKRLEANPKFTPEERSQILQQHETQYQENTAFFQKQHEARIAYLKQIGEDASLNGEQKKAAMREYMKKQKDEAREHFKNQQTENKSLWSSLKSPAA